MRYCFIISLSFFVAFSAIAQETSFSPYSRFGIGELNGTFLNRHFSMGGLSTGLYDPLGVNPSNAASYSLLSEPSFELGINSNWLILENSEEKVSGNVTRINHVALGLPLRSSKMGVAFGLTPISRIGYDISRSDSIQDIAYAQENIGSGGVNSLFLGFGRKFNLKTDSVSYGKGLKASFNHTLAIGFNFNYLFGSRVNLSREIFPAGSGFVNTQRSNIDNISDVSFDFSVLASTWLKKRMKRDDSSIRLNLGATYTPATLLRSERSEVVESFLSVGGNEFFVDSIQSNESIQGNVNIPTKLALGVSIDLISKKNNKYTLGIEMRNRSWSEYYEDFDEKEISTELVNSIRMAVGLEYVPNNLFTLRGANIQGSEYFKAISYRIGAFQQNGYLNIENEELSETGINFGVGLPFVRGRRKLTSSELSFGFQMSTRGSVENGLIEERNNMLFIGLRLNPDMVRNPWFVKRKYD
ncbi:MAG: hypothetical protein HKN39_03725 [Flavobacteriales bacterium]|nr:hypothetical protein [Flavobacteriales bacterium]